MKLFVVRKKSLVLFFVFIVLLVSSVVTYFCIKPVLSPKYQYKIIIDAGHGGIDNGCVGYSGSYESELNLKYAMSLKRYCEDFGYKVVLTRSNKDGLYSPFASNKKKDDMQKRKEIIQKANPDIVISIHMNSYPEEYCRGAQVFYKDGSQSGKFLADCIQKQFVQNLVKARRSSQTGDYYILNESQCTSVICECGFISNKQEEELLKSDDYCNQVCYSILCGLMSYFV